MNFIQFNVFIQFILLLDSRRELHLYVTFIGIFYIYFFILVGLFAPGHLQIVKSGPL